MEFKGCNKQIHFGPDVQSNYMAEIMQFFKDTQALIDAQPLQYDFAHAMSFLQAIYIQQDLVEELLFIFKCKSNKAKLKSDKNYAINRNLRNEFVGHPIRRDVHTRKFVSSSFYRPANSAQPAISYIRYRRETNYKQEWELHLVDNIKARHQRFVQQYLAEVLHDIGIILHKFNTRVLQVCESLISTGRFANLIDYVEEQLKPIACEPMFTSENLKYALERKVEHERYHYLVVDYIHLIWEGVSNLKKLIKLNYPERGELVLIPVETKYVLVKNEPIDIDSDFSKLKIVGRSRITVKKRPSVEQAYPDCNYEITKLYEVKSNEDFEFYWNGLHQKLNAFDELKDELTFLNQSFGKTMDYYPSLVFLNYTLNSKKLPEISIY